jgi:hypothetical protein
MNLFLRSANLKYAVIQVSGKSDLPGRFLLTYPDEQSRIFDHGISHLQNAAALVADSSIQSITSGGTKRAQRVNRCSHRRFASWKLRLAAGINRGKPRGIAYSAVQFAFASAILALYSENILCSTFRTILGI